eukprot:SAG31_NODE_816_length_11865_cov_38.805116_4_plen_221_part_00
MLGLALPPRERSPTNILACATTADSMTRAACTDRCRWTECSPTTGESYLDRSGGHIRPVSFVCSSFSVYGTTFSFALDISDGAINGTLLVANGSQFVDSVAALSEDGKSLSAAVGRMGAGSVGGACGPVGAVGENRTMLRFEGVPATIGSAGESTVAVAIARIPDSKTAPLLSPLVTTQAVHILANSVIEILLELAPGDAALVLVGTEAETALQAFATPP